MSARGQEFGQIGEGVDGAAGGGAGSPGDPQDVALEGDEPVLGGDGDGAVAHEQDRAIGQRRVEARPPFLGVLGTDEAGDSTQRREGECHGQLCGAGVVHSLGVAKHDAGGNVLHEFVDTGGQGLDDPQPRHARQQRHRDVRAAVGDHEELHLRQTLVSGRIACALPHRHGQSPGQAADP